LASGVEAKRQLRYTTLAVADISSDLHFDTTSYFIRFFRKHAGMTPLEFRKRQE
jgi:AraC family transcriptional activator of pobA